MTIQQEGGKRRKQNILVLFLVLVPDLDLVLGLVLVKKIIIAKKKHNC